VKILWVNAQFLHPTTKGGQIRTLEMLKRLHRHHEIHYVAFENDLEPEGPKRSHEYSTRAYPLKLQVPPKNSPAFMLQLLKGAFSSVPLAVSRFYSPEARTFLSELMHREKFDKAVCDFLVSTSHFPKLSSAVLFQHNIETMIWRRRAEQARNPVERFYITGQAKRMFQYERLMSQHAGFVVTVSPSDAELTRKLFNVSHVADVPTGVDTEYFARPHVLPVAPRSDVVFVGSMDWLPNIDGMGWFVREVLPLIRRRRSGCSVAIVGRSPAPEIVALAKEDPHLTVTGTVPDIRPWLWNSSISIVPLRIGGGTRLKIYESMAAGIPVVSTEIGAEGLPVKDGEMIRLADGAENFADACIHLLEDDNERRRISAVASDFVAANYSWDHVIRHFEALLERAPDAV
jgi:glycosyltransferase involved in cell wall biosynthesis